MAQVALAWVIDRPAVTSTILGARRAEPLEDNLGAADLHLNEMKPLPWTKPVFPRLTTTPMEGAASISAAGLFLRISPRAVSVTSHGHPSFEG